MLRAALSQPPNSNNTSTRTACRLWPASYATPSTPRDNLIDMIKSSGKADTAALLVFFDDPDVGPLSRLAVALHRFVGVEMYRSRECRENCAPQRVG